MEPDEINRTLRRVFGDGNIEGADGDDGVVWVHGDRSPGPALGEYQPARQEPVLRREPPPQRVDPRFERLMTAPPVVALGASEKAIADGKTWLYAATHSPSDERCAVLLKAAIPVVAALVGEPTAD